MGLYFGGKLVSPVIVVEKPVVTDEWQPNPNWWDIKKILDEDTRDYPGKVGAILYNFNDESDFTLSSSGMTAVATSDGAFYSYANNGSKIKHNWDTAQDKDDGRGFKTRWAIYYYTTDTTSDAFLPTVAKFGWARNYIAYLVLRINCSNGYNLCSSQFFLEGVDNLGYVISGSSFGNFLASCFSLQKLPDNIDTSNGTSFRGFCQFCYSLQNLTLDIDTSNGVDFYGFCEGNFSLKKIPDNIDTSKGTNFYNFLKDCRSLTRVPHIDATGSITNDDYMLNSLRSLLKVSADFSGCSFSANYNAPFYSSYWLKEAFIVLPSLSNFWLSASPYVSIESFRYIADRAPDVTATPRTLAIGSTNITRCNEADPTIITDLNAKGWTVS